MGGLADSRMSELERDTIGTLLRCRELSKAAVLPSDKDADTTFRTDRDFFGGEEAFCFKGFGGIGGRGLTGASSKVNSSDVQSLKLSRLFELVISSS